MARPTRTKKETDVIKTKIESSKLKRMAWRRTIVKERRI